MNANSAPLTWDQYSSNSSEDNKIDNPLITEATQQLFLRKYSSFPLTVYLLFFNLYRLKNFLEFLKLAIMMMILSNKNLMRNSQRIRRTKNIQINRKEIIRRIPIIQI